jgi:hypothetical protein
MVLNFMVAWSAKVLDFKKLVIPIFVRICSTNTVSKINCNITTDENTPYAPPTPYARRISTTYARRIATWRQLRTHHMPKTTVCKKNIKITTSERAP